MVVAQRWVAYEPNGPRLGVLPDALEYSASTPADPAEELGAATLAYSAEGRGGLLVSRPLTTGTEIALEVWNGADWVEPPGARYIVPRRRHDLVDNARVIRLTAPAYGAVLRKIVHLAPSEDLYATEGVNEGRRKFEGTTAGGVLATLLAEYEARGGTTIARDFTASTDSNGQPWPGLLAFWISRGEQLDVTIRRLWNDGSLGIWWTGRTLHAAPSRPARELAASIVIDKRHVREAPSEENIEDLITHRTLYGDGLLVTTDSAGLPSPWGRWEAFASDQRISDAATATAHNQRVLAEAGRLRGQYVRDLTPDCPHTPGVDFLPGDWITAPTTVNRERVRVAGLLWHQDSSGTTRSLVLQDSLRSPEVRIRERQRTEESTTTTVSDHSRQIDRALTDARTARDLADSHETRVAEVETRVTEAETAVNELNDRMVLWEERATKAVMTQDQTASGDTRVDVTGAVYWRGAPQPSNAVEGDLWWDGSAV